MENDTNPSRWRRLYDWCCARTRRGQAWARKYLPWGIRTIVGLALIGLGIVGIVVPFIGPWLIPVGGAIAFLDIRPLWLRWKARQS